MLVPAFFLFISSMALLCNTQGYCTRAAGLYNVSDGGVACLQAGLYNVADCCFTCGATGPGYNARCGSLYNYNTAQSCSDMAAITQAQSDCGGTGFTCRCNGGSDLSQLMGTPPPPSATPTGTSTSSTTPSPTGGPTNSAGDGIHGSVLLVVTSAFALYTIVCL